MKYKQDVQDMEIKRAETDIRMKDMEKAIAVREQEIQRLNLMYRGGQTFDQVKSTFDKST